MYFTVLLIAIVSCLGNNVNVNTHSHTPHSKSSNRFNDQYYEHNKQPASNYFTLIGVSTVLVVFVYLLFFHESKPTPDRPWRNANERSSSTEEDEHTVEKPKQITNQFEEDDEEEEDYTSELSNNDVKFENVKFDYDDDDDEDIEDKDDREYKPSEE